MRNIDKQIESHHHHHFDTKIPATLFMKYQQTYRCYCLRRDIVQHSSVPNPNLNLIDHVSYA
jgi:hypothetical protein